MRRITTFPATLFAGALAVLGLLGALAALYPAVSHAQGATEAWVQRYNGPGDGADWANAVAVGTNGSVYVTGGSYGGDPLYGGSSMDYATIAYSSAGLPLWSNYYNGPVNNGGIARAIAVDSSGNVVVTGTASSESGSIVATIKYSSEGIALWTNRQSLGVCYVTTLDTSGNVIVMGAPSSYVGCLTLKYSSGGSLLWSKTYSDYSRPSGSVGALAVDGSGNIFVVGSTASSGKYQTLKYSSAGVLLWTRQYSGPGTGVGNYANGVAVDASGNVYVTGQSAGAGGSEPHYDFATIKYSGSGVPLWTNCYNGPTADNDCAMAIAVDPGSNVVVTGWSGGVGGIGIDYLTIKYSSTGVPLWTNRLSAQGSDFSYLAVDTRGNVYVTGISWGGDALSGGSGDDYIPFAYSSSGVLVCTNRYNGPGNDGDRPFSITVDSSGSVYVTGHSEGIGSGEDPTRDDWATIKYVTPAIITRPPVSQTNAVGTTASFTVEAAGNLPLTYQWRRQGTNLMDGPNLFGVTTPNLQIANVQFTDAAGYSVVLTNAFGSVTSSVAQLTVTIRSNPGRFSNLSYSPETGFSFIFRDGTVGRQYRIQTSSSLAEGSWVDWRNFTYSGPAGFMDVDATGTEQHFYRAVSP